MPLLQFTPPNRLPPDAPSITTRNIAYTKHHACRKPLRLRLCHYDNVVEKQFCPPTHPPQTP